MGDWYYIGHYGQLGPLTREQVDELVVGGVIVRETYVWRPGMTDWIPAEKCFELQAAFQLAAPAEPPPRPTPPTQTPRSSAPPTASSSYGAYASGATGPAQFGTNYTSSSSPGPGWPAADYALQSRAGFQPVFPTSRSDRSRAVAGILQILLPGVGRMYLGYLAYGVLQLILTIATCGLLWIWSFIDGIIILTGGVKLDGYGRQITD